MIELDTLSTKKAPEVLSLTAFKYGESPFPSKFAFHNDTADRILTIAWLFFLIQYKEYNILVDTGNGDLSIHEGYGFYMNKFSDPIELLASYGLTPDKITDVIITHSDFDHIGEINHFKNAAIYIHEDELEVCKDGIENSLNIVTFKKSLNLYDKFKIEYFGGHTKGSSIVTFQHGQTNYVLAGDECYVNENLEKQIPTGRFYDLTKSTEFIKKFNTPNYVVLLSHEPSIVPGEADYKVLLP